MDDEELRRLLDVTERAGGLATWAWDTAIPRAHRWSRGMQRLLELPDDRQDLDLFFERVHPDDRPRVRAIYDEAQGTGVVRDLDFRCVLPSGQILFLRGTGVAVQPAGEPPRFVGTLLDISQRVSLERKLADAEKSRAIAALAAGVAHDLGNWLTVLRHVADQLGETHPVRQDMERALAPCFSLTRELLALAQERPAETRLVDLRERLGALVPVLRAVLGAEAELEVGCDEPLWVEIDPAHLEGVLLNLAVNARDAMPARGRLVVRGRAEAHEVVIEVSDDGHGISPDRLPRVFDPYFTTKPVGRGTGLGLASVKGTVLQHGGEVGVRSELGHGTTFEIRFPRRAPPRVLVVDDLPEVREVVCEVLRRAGISVLEANEGGEALDVLRGTEVDLVLTDLVMPGMDGETLVDLLLERGGPPVVVVTGFASDRVRTKVPVVRKPFRPAEVLDAVGRALVSPRRRARA